MSKSKLLTVILVLSVLVLITTGCGKTTNNIDEYLNTNTDIDIASSYVMPKLETLAEYEGISYNLVEQSLIVFESQSIALKVKYTKKNAYENEKDTLVNQYEFLDSKVLSDFDNSKYYIPEYEFSISEYDFKVVDISSDPNTQYPKSFGMIGTSDSQNSIVYLYYYDLDLDYIDSTDDQPMATFVSDNFDIDL